MTATVQPAARTEGKYLVLFEKGHKDVPDYGSVNSIQAGDILCLYLEGFQHVVVEKITGSKWTKQIRTADITYNGHLVEKGLIVDPETIRKVLRLKPGEQGDRSLDEI